MTRAGARLTMAAAVACAAALSGCGQAVEGLAEGAVERALENELGESADVEINEDGYTVDTEEGSTSVGAGSVPEDFPSDVPLLEGEVSFSQTLDTASETTWTLLLTVAGDPSEVADQVLQGFESRGFTVEETSEFSGTAGVGGSVIAEKDDLSAFVLIAGEGAETAVTYTVTRQP